MKQYVILSFISVLWYVPLNAYIYELYVLHKFNPGTQKNQYIIAFGDWHDRKEQSVQHRTYLEYLLARFNTQETHVIIEDLSTGHQLDKAMCGIFTIDTRGGVLGGLVPFCKGLGLSVENIEYRYCRVAALAPVLRAHDKDPSKHVSSNKLSVETLLKEYTAAYEQALMFCTETSQYMNMLKEANEHMHRLQWPQSTQQTVASYVHNHTRSVNERGTLLDTLLTFDAPVFDVRILASIMNAHDKNYIILCAGGTHVHHVCTMLKKYGYSEVISKKNSAVHVMPEPVNLKIIERFF